MLDNLQHYDIVLGSRSPRRQDLLKMLGLQFRAKAIDNIREEYPPTLPCDDIPEFLSQKKAQAYHMEPKELLITADTLVIHNSSVLGKPKNAEEASSMLHALANAKHHVVTGVTITTARRSVSFKETTIVHFSSLTDSEIEYYISNFTPFDKAGAYGIQDWIGLIGIDHIEGCFYNVMGLPVFALYQHLKLF